MTPTGKTKILFGGAEKTHTYPKKPSARKCSLGHLARYPEKKGFVLSWRIPGDRFLEFLSVCKLWFYGSPTKQGNCVFVGFERCYYSGGETSSALV